MCNWKQDAVGTCTIMRKYLHFRLTNITADILRILLHWPLTLQYCVILGQLRFYASESCEVRFFSAQPQLVMT